MRLKAPQTTSTPRRALGAPQPKLRREVAERALQRPRARRAARLGVGRRLAPHQTPALGLGQRPRHAHARLDGAPRRRVGLVARVRRLAPYLSRVERDDPRRRGPRRRPGVLDRRARAGGVEAPPGRAVEDDLLAAQRVLDRAAQRLVGVVSAVYGDGDVVDRSSVCVRYPARQATSNSSVHLATIGAERRTEYMRCSFGSARQERRLPSSRNQASSNTCPAQPSTELSGFPGVDEARGWLREWLRERPAYLLAS